MTNIPERGSQNPCPDCGVPVKNEHSLRQSAICDGIRNNKINRLEGQAMIKRMVSR